MSLAPSLSLKMALTCTIYENNLKSEVMKGNNQKLKKHNIQHAYITTFCTLPFSEVPVSDMSVREIVSKISLSGGQGFVNCQCKKGNCKSGRCKYRRLKVMCNFRCHMSLSCLHIYPFICPTLVPIL
jgi:hypothetical protein